MKPWTSIWVKTKETIDQFKDSNWVNGQGLLLYFIFGINAASESDIPRLFGYESKLEGLIIVLITIILLGLLGGLILRAVWTNLIFYFGKIWKGQASRKNIDTVIALSLIPEIFKLVNLILSYITQDNIEDAKINYVVIIICALLTFRIFIVGLSRVQKFSYAISILNVVVPQITLWLLYFLVRGL